MGEHCKGKHHGPKFDTIEEKLYFQLVKCSHLISRGPGGPGRPGPGGPGPEPGPGGPGGPGQRRALELLAKKGTATQSELREELGIRAGSLSELLAKLESRALICREKNEADARSVVVSITDLGRDVLEESKQMQKERAQKKLEALSDEEKQQLSELLHKLMHSWRPKRGPKPEEEGPKD